MTSEMSDETRWAIVERRWMQQCDAQLDRMLNTASEMQASLAKLAEAIADLTGRPITY